MPNWKKVVVSGSDAALSSLNVTGNVTAGTLTGNGSGVTNVTAASVAYANISGLPTLVSSSGQIDHNATTNYVANRHIDHTTVSITAGSGLTGGGDISATRTVNVGAGLGMTVNADDIAINTGSTHFTNGVKAKLNTDQVLSGSVSSPSQGTINVGGFTNIDLGLQSGDSPTFASVTATNFTGTASRATVGEKVDVISGGSTTGLGVYSGSFSGSFFGVSGGGSGTVGPGTVNSLALFNASSTISSSTVFQSGNNIGIGTTTPSTRLQVAGSVVATAYNEPTVLGAVLAGDGTNGLLYARNGSTGWAPMYIDASSLHLNAQSNGNVGIGTTNPSTKLHVNGTVSASVFQVTNANASTGINITSATTAGGGSVVRISRTNTTTNQAYISFDSDQLYMGVAANDTNAYIGTKAGAALALQTNYTSRIFIRDNGNVGIGTTNPTASLHVVGASLLANGTTIDPDSHQSTVIAGNIQDGSGWGALGIGGNGGGVGDSWAIAHNGSALYFGMQDNTSVNTMQTYMRFDPNRNVYLVEASGNVGIGTVSPATKLHVQGVISASRITVSSTAVATNLNADLLDGQEGSYYAAASSLSSYLPLGGGTMTGAITFAAGQTWPTFNQNTTGQAGSVANAVTFNNGGAGAASGTTFNGSAARTISYNTVGAAAASHTHAISEVTGLQTALDGKAASSHTHAISDVTGLQTALDGKLATAGGTITGALTVNGVITLGIAGATSVISSTTSYGDGTTLIMRGPSAGSFQLQPNSTKAGIFLSSSGNVGIDTVQPKYKLDVSNNTVRLGRVYREFQEYTGASANKLVRTWDGVLVAGSDDGSAETYTIIDTGVPQDSYMMGGFTIEWFENYSSTNAKTQIKIAGYWNPEGNSGFIGFEYTTSNPYIRPTIQVARNSSTGNTAFILSHFNASYPIIVARDLWLGYSTGADTYGTGWTIKQAANTTGYTNFDTVVARGAAPIDQTMHVGTTAIAINRGSGAQTLTGVSIDGNAATATTATTAGALTSMNISQFTNNSGYITGLSFDGLSSKTGGTGTYTTTGDFRAPIFYDSNNTAYYVDPNSISKLAQINLGTPGTRFIAHSSAQGYTYIYGSASNYLAIGPYDNNGWAYFESVGNANGMYFSVPAGGNYRFDVGNILPYDDNEISLGSPSLRFTTLYLSSTGQSAGDFRAPIFYDSSNTGYYFDGASTSVLNAIGANTIYNIGLGSSYYFTQGSWGWRHQTPSGYIEFGPANTSHAHIYTDRSNFYFNNMIQVLGGSQIYQNDIRSAIFYDKEDTTYYTDPNGYSNVWGVAIRGDTSSTNIGNQIFFWGGGGTTTSAIGFKANGGNFTNPTGNGDGYNTYFTMDSEGRGWVFRRGTGGSDFSSAYTAGWILNNGVWQANASMRSPIFYDSNDTTYYIDPTSTTSLRTVGSWRANSADWDGEYSGKIQYHASHWYFQSGDLWIFRNSAGGNIVTINQNGVISTGGDMRSPIFYDANDTTYYIDPNTTATSINVRGEIRNPSIWINDGDNVNAYNENIRLFNASNGVCVIAFSATGTSGTPTTSILGFGDRHEVRFNDGWQTRIYNGYAEAAGSYRAPLFYDSNDTSYYLNPNSTTSGNMRGNMIFGDYGAGIVGSYASTRFQGVFAMGDAYKLPIDGNGVSNLYGLTWSHPNAGGIAANLNTHGLLAVENGSWLASLCGSTRARDDMRAPIFYDNNDTNYYVDPNGTARLSTIYCGNVYNDLGGWFRNYGATGIYNQSYGNHFYAESLTYWVLHSSNGMVIKDGYAGTNKGYLYYDSSGFGLLHSSGGWTVRTTTSIVEVYGTFYAPNLYDSNDTNYYVNPAGTSVMNQINLAYLYGNVEPASSNNSSTSYSVAAIELRESQYGGSSAYLPPRLGFHWGGVVASQISVESSGRISIINNPGSGYESLIGSILYGNESVRGPIFYDTNNTGYYVDPNSTGDSIRCAGDIVAFYSDERLKDIEYNIPNAVEKIKTLNGFYFTPNELAQKMGYQKKREVGLSAQEVERVLPEIIKEAPIDARYKTIDYSKLVPLLVEAIKEQQTKIEELELFINNLKH